MRQFLAILILSFCSQANSAVAYSDSDFSLVLGGDWVQVRLLFAEHVVFRSEALGLQVKIMGITQPVRPERTRLVATKLLEESIRREHAAAKAGVTVTITKQEIYALSDGTAGTYRGFDSSGRSFVTVEHTRPIRSVLMFFEAPTSNAANLDQAVEAVVQGLSQ